ncbi:DUF2064 domain-containing protein [Deltaproteobacteria bacterium TL4]
MNSLLILFARYPKVGTVKTRLSRPEFSDPPVPPVQACRLYQTFLDALIPRFQKQDHFDFKIMLGGANAKELELFRAHYELTPAQISAMPAHTQDIGILMEHCFERFSAQGYQRMVVIGSDIPHLSQHHIQKALTLLRQFPVVIGPDNAGGMYLVGYTKPWGMMKEGIQWSQGTDCQEVLRRCEVNQRAFALLDQEIDIDTRKDLVEWMTWAKKSCDKASNHDLYLTLKTIQKIISEPESALKS